MTALFLDTGFLIALESRSDQHHDAARRYWRLFCDHPSLLITASFVFDEAVTFFNSRSRHDKAVEIGTYLKTNHLVEMQTVDGSLLDLAWDMFKLHSDKRYSLTDCVSFVVMKQRNMTNALTFDQHFRQAGFVALPGEVP